MLQFLLFEQAESDDGTHTWEAMASVPPARWSALWQEAESVLTQVQHLLPNGPLPLDEGGDWDVLLQIQVDEHPLQTLCWPLQTTTDTMAEPVAPDGAPHHIHWIALTLTLAVSEALVPALADWLPND